MAQKVFAMMLALTLTATWLGVSAAQQPATGQVLRVASVTVSQDKRDQLSTVVDEMARPLAGAKGVLWFKVGSDSTTGEVVLVMLWNSQADIDAFLKSDARKASLEKTKSLSQGDPLIKNYHVSEAKK